MLNYKMVFAILCWVLANSVTLYKAEKLSVHLHLTSHVFLKNRYTHHCSFCAKPNTLHLAICKPEPIMLLFFPEFSIFVTHYSLYIPMLSPIILYYFTNLIVLLVKLHMATDEMAAF